jgi:hypothetical protein
VELFNFIFSEKQLMIVEKLIRLFRTYILRKPIRYGSSIFKIAKYTFIVKHIPKEKNKNSIIMMGVHFIECSAPNYSVNYIAFHLKGLHLRFDFGPGRFCGLKISKSPIANGRFYFEFS